MRRYGFGLSRRCLRTTAVSMHFAAVSAASRGAWQWLRSRSTRRGDWLAPCDGCLWRLGDSRESVKNVLSRGRAT